MPRRGTKRRGACGLQQYLGAGRFAPSPSGDLHLGNLRTAMLAWLFARTTGRAFFVRIEDLDRARDAGSAAQQLDDLRELGIDWQGSPVVQSERSGVYDTAFQQLQDAGLVYECTCSRREIAEATTAPHGTPGAYPGTCRDRSATERASARAGIAPRQPALRLRTPQTGRKQVFTDLVLGEIEGTVDDMVLKRGDGAYAYNLAVVVDDAHSAIDQVVRGDDLVDSTPRQLLLQELLGLPRPEYAHVPLVLGPKGARLAKRDGAVTLNELKKQGVSVAAVRQLLAHSLCLAERGEDLTMHELAVRFEVIRLPTKPWQIDPHQLITSSARE